LATKVAPNASLQAVEVALTQAEGSSGGGASQAALMASLTLQTANAPVQVANVTEGESETTGVLLSSLAAGAGKRTGAGKAAVTAGLAQGAAKSAADRQLLPFDQGGSGSLSRQIKADMVQPVSVSLSGSVAQSLAAQPQVGVTDLLAPVAGQSTLTGVVGQGAGVMGEVQARPANGSMQLSIDAPIRSPLFSQELGERVVWLASRQGQVAGIVLNPPHLGPLEVRLSLHGGEAGAQFFSPHPQVRDAIEAALPRLREMMAEAGVTLGQANVRDEAFSRQESFGQENIQHIGLSGDEGDSIPSGGDVGRSVSRLVGLGLVDLYV
jgi:flagellar hook-length control protein FliK